MKVLTTTARRRNKVCAALAVVILRQVDADYLNRFVMATKCTDAELCTGCSKLKPGADSDIVVGDEALWDVEEYRTNLSSLRCSLQNDPTFCTSSCELCMTASDSAFVMTDQILQQARDLKVVNVYDYSGRRFSHSTRYSPRVSCHLWSSLGSGESDVTAVLLDVLNLMKESQRPKQPFGFVIQPESNDLHLVHQPKTEAFTVLADPYTESSDEEFVIVSPGKPEVQESSH